MVSSATTSTLIADADEIPQYIGGLFFGVIFWSQTESLDSEALSFFRNLEFFCQILEVFFCQILEFFAKSLSFFFQKMNYQRMNYLTLFSWCQKNQTYASKSFKN